MSNYEPSGQNADNEVEKMAHEYDFSHSARGKHAEDVRNGYTMLIHRSDGTTEVREVKPRPGTVVLDPDVRAHFPDPSAVNRALRQLLQLTAHGPSSNTLS